MDQAIEATALFADISGSTKLYESEGDKAAMEAIARCVEPMRRTADKSGHSACKHRGILGC